MHFLFMTEEEAKYEMKKFVQHEDVEEVIFETDNATERWKRYHYNFRIEREERGNDEHQ